MHFPVFVQDSSPTSDRDELSRTTSFSYDSQGRLTQRSAVLRSSRSRRRARHSRGLRDRDDLSTAERRRQTALAVVTEAGGTA